MDLNRTKIVFVEPRAKENIFSQYMNLPLLGPVYLATILQQNGYEVQVINENILKRGISKTELDADILCMTGVTATIERGYEIIDQFKKQNPGGKVIIGGIHASFMPEEAAKHADHVLVGEGEKVILDLVQGRFKQKIVYGEQLSDLDEAPIPDLSLIKDSHKIKPSPVMTSRGCPFNCKFCAVTQMFGRKIRSNSVNRVIEEISLAKQKTIFFYDDHFAAFKHRLHEILDRIKQERINKTWSAQVRIDIAKDPELVAKMNDTGCDWVYVGLESVNPETLKQYNKAQTVQNIKESIKIFHDNNINVHGMFVLGSDADDKKVFDKTSTFCNVHKIDTAQFSILTPVPGSAMYKTFVQNKRLLHNKWRFYDGLHAVFKPKQMTALDLQTGMIDTFKSFYNYKKGIKNFISETINAGITKVEAIIAKRKNRSFTFHYKFAGKNIIRRWLKQNSHYFEYLKKPQLLYGKL